MFGLADIVGKEICDALGIKHGHTIDIHIEKGEIVTATVGFYPEADGVMQFPAILKKYRLVEIEEEKPEEDRAKEVFDRIASTNQGQER